MNTLIAPSVVMLSAVLAVGACSPPERPAEPKSPVVSTKPTATPPARADVADILTSAGYGPLRIGMTRAEVDQAMGPPTAAGESAINDCLYYRPTQAPEGLLVMLVDGVLMRITLRSPSRITTEQGLGIGTPSQEVRAAYGDSGQWGAHAYVDRPAGYLTVWTDKPRPGGAYVEEAEARGVVYEIDAQGRVEAIHAGGPSIQWVEGCA